MIKNRLKILFLFLGITVLINSCVSPPEDFVAPTYDVTLAFPITDSVYTLNDFIEDDSTIVPSDDPNNLGLLVYTNSNSIDAFYVNEYLKINSSSSYTATSIGTIRIGDVPPVKTTISISDWAPISEGADVVFPEVSSPISSQFDIIEEFESAVFQSGKMEITISNDLPVITELQEFKIINSSDESVVVESPNNSPIITQPFESTTVDFDLTDITIRNNLMVSAIIYTPGSGTDTVTIPTNAGTGIEIVLTDLVIESVTGKIKEQDPINITDSLTIDDSTKVEEIEFSSGSFQIVMNNYFDLDLNISFEITNLFDENDKSYDNTFSLKRNEKNRIIEIPSLKDWKIKTLTPGIPSNKLNYSVTVLIAPSDGVNTIHTDDSVTVNINFSESFISYAEGLIKPTKFDIPKSEIDFDLGDFKDTFNFDSLFINTSKMLIGLSSSVNFDVSLNTVITGSSSNISKDLVVQLDLDKNSEQEFDLDNFGFTEFLNNFTATGEIPDKFSISGSGIINPNYTLGSIASTDSVAGNILFELPFDFGISGGSFQDTVTLFEDEIDETTIESINSVELTIETLNKIPVNLTLQGTVLDQEGNPILNFPTEYSSEPYILIEAPVVDENGNVISAEMKKQIIRLNGDDAGKLLRNPDVIFTFSLYTPPQGSVAPVKFRSSDTIYFKVYGKTDYRTGD